MNGAIPTSHPTTSDISMLMKELGFKWSNEGQIYYSWNYQHIDSKTAEFIYERLLGNKPYTPIKNHEDNK